MANLAPVDRLSVARAPVREPLHVPYRGARVTLYCFLQHGFHAQISVPGLYHSMSLLMKNISRTTMIGLLLIFGGCTKIGFHEKGRILSPLMDLSDSAAETHLYQKVYYSREGSSGGIGSTAGGGCGCY